MEFILEILVKSKTDGQMVIGFPIKSSRMITTVTPAVPMFFWAPPNITPN